MLARHFSFSATILSAVATLLFATAAKADFIADESFRLRAESFDLLIGVVTPGLKVETVYDKNSGETHLGIAEMRTFLEIASAQTQIWGDTILEGDYAASNETQVDHIDVLIKLGTVISYRIFYSQKAWDTSNCSYTGHLQELSQCDEGRISEASFVAPDFASWLRDPNAYAEFESK